MPSKVTNYIDRHSELREVEKEALESTLDLAEAKLIENVEKGKEVFFYLKCKGKHRGYVEKDKGIRLDAFHRALEQLAVAVAEEVSDES